jgi:two-component system, sensor histidine kinase and response regulator
LVNGHAALHWLEQHRYDVILMDVQMPGLNGLEATAAIRQREAGETHVAIIAMTAHALPSDRERCLAACMDAYLVKPLHAAALLSVVERLGGSGAAPRRDRGDTYLAAEPCFPVALFEAAAALAHCYDRPELLAEMIQSLQTDCAQLLPAMWAACERGDPREVGHLGHRLKGTLSNLAAGPAEAAARQVERVWREESEGSADARTRIGALERACALLRSALAEYCLATAPRLRRCASHTHQRERNAVHC